MQHRLVLVIIAIGVAAGIGLTLYALLPTSTQASTISDDSVVITDDVIYGKTLEAWAQSYWNWSVSTPRVDEISLNSTTGMSECYIGSDSDGLMAFLIDPYDAKYTTTCSISSTRPILVPLLISECDSMSEADLEGKEIGELWACAQEYNEVFKSWDVTLDGKTIFRKVGNEEINTHLVDEILVRNSSKFTWYIPENNRFDFPSGSTDAVVDGYYMILRPLAPGEHVLEYKIVHEQESPGADLSQIFGDVTYYLNVT